MPASPTLAARAVVLTGEAAVTLGATGQGMVAGDLVNTASRIQALAAPGTVLVAEMTRKGVGGLDRVRRGRPPRVEGAGRASARCGGRSA